MTQELGDWVLENGVSLDWLFRGTVKPALTSYKESSQSKEKITTAIKELDPSIVKGMATMIKAVVLYDLPMEKALVVFDEVYQDWKTLQGETEQT